MSLPKSSHARPAWVPALWFVAASAVPSAALADVDFVARKGWGPIKAAHSNLCLNVPGGNTAIGTQLNQEPCNGSTAQNWQVKPIGEGFSLINQATGQCLDSQPSQQWAGAVVQRTCNGAAEQTWSAQSQGAGYRLVTAYSGHCLDVYGGYTGSTTPMIQYGCHGAGNQTFIPSVASAATAVRWIPTYIDGWYPKEMFLFARNAKGVITDQMTVISYTWGVTRSENNPASDLFLVPPGSTWGVGMKVWPNQDKSRSGTPQIYYSDSNGQNLLETSGDCATGTRKDNWGDNGKKAKNVVYTLSCDSSSSSDASAAATTAAGGGASTGGAATGTDTGTNTGSNAGVTPPGETAPTTASVLINRRSGNCMDASNGAVKQEICKDLPSQNWTFLPTANGYQIKSASTGQCLAIRDAGQGSGSGLMQQACSTAANAVFRLRKLDKWFEIVPAHSSKCLSPNAGGDGRDSGTDIVQWQCDAADHQRWTILGAEGRAPSAWTSPRRISMVPVAGSTLPNGKLLFWAAESRTSFWAGTSQMSTWTTIYDPSNDQANEIEVTAPGSNMFCPGTNILPDGRILVTGGISDYNATVYNPETNAWSRVANMKIGRGYNASTTLSNGDSLTFGGSWEAGNASKDAEVWSSATNTWRVLPNVKGNAVIDPGVEQYPGDTHFWLFAGPNGSVFHAGPSVRMHWIGTSGDGSLRYVGDRGQDQFSVNGTASMYDIGKIFKAGGSTAYTGTPSLDTAYTIDITSGPSGTPVVAEAAPMLFPRTYMNSVVLPDGDVITAGGQIVAAQFTDNRPVMMPEIWSPKTGKVRRLAPMAVPRNYHSIGMLLLDGRVLFGGGGLCGGCGGADHLDFEIMTPPYLYDAEGKLASRPGIVQAPNSASRGGTLSVNTDRTVSSFSLVRLSAVTHSTNNDQRRVPLTIAKSSGSSYQLTLPADPGILLPGTWMLFAMDANGVPSTAKVVRIQ